MKKNRVCFATSVHSRYDTRMFLKECISLHNQGIYDVSLIVDDGKGVEINSGINIYDIGKQRGRLYRFFITTRLVYRKAVELNCDIYHLQDPEMIPYIRKLRKLKKLVVFDVHENIALQIRDKDYLVKPLRTFISSLYRFYEKISLKKCNGLLLAENSYYKYYKNIFDKPEVILNMPQKDVLNKFYSENRDKNDLFYIGGVNKNRGVEVIIDALKIIKDSIQDIFMHYIGPYDDSLIKILDLKEIEQNVKFYGRLSLLDGLEMSRKAKIGLSILKPIDNYRESYSTKIFEYMAIGLPVITSNFVLYKEVIEAEKCGRCINPDSPSELSEAVIDIITNPEVALEMGKNGRKAVEEKYNWEIEEKKLIRLYHKILSKN